MENEDYKNGYKKGYNDGLQAVYGLVEMYVLTCPDDLTKRSQGKFEAYTNICGVLKKALEMEDNDET